MKTKMILTDASVDIEKKSIHTTEKAKRTAKILIHVAFMAFLLLPVLVSCGGHRGNSGRDGSQTSRPESGVKPPAMDIHTAVFMGDFRALEQHISAGTDLDQKDEYGSTPLMIAVTFNKPDVARTLIEGGADVNCTNNDGSTPLHTAAFLCRTELVEILLASGADKNMKNNFGSTALESIQVPFESVTAIYDRFSRDLGPLGLKLDYDRIREMRPVVAGMLQ